MVISSTNHTIGQSLIPFHLGSGLAPFVAEKLRALEPDQVIVVTDPLIWGLHGAQYASSLQAVGRLKIIPVHSGEANKTLATIEHLAGDIVAGEATRRSILLGIGGGVVGNLTGLTASLLYRGIRFAHVPTTLMAMHDSVTSLKQGVNCNQAKNILGLFAAPSAVFIDLRFLESLPKPHIVAGLAELLKNGLVLGGQYLSAIANYLQNPAGEASHVHWADLIQLGISAKLSVMKNDPHERGQAMIMEYGHTIGHAIELASGGEINHGQSVAWGMRCAGWISHEVGHMSKPALEEHERLIDLLGHLPRLSRGFSVDELWHRAQLDNKRGYLPVGQDNSVAMVLLHKPGAVVNQDQPFPLTLVRGEVIRKALEKLAKIAK